MQVGPTHESIPRAYFYFLCIKQCTKEAIEI